MKKTYPAILSIFEVVLLCFILDSFCRCEALPDEWEIFKGVMTAPLKESEDYVAFPTLIGLMWDIPCFTKDRSWMDWVKMDGIFEPYSLKIVEPRRNFGMGLNVLLKCTLLLEEDYSPYVKVGVGVDYMTLHTKEQSTQWNFGSQIGLGLEIPLARGFELDLEYRFKHVSNASIRHPNSGIDSSAWLVGLRWRDPKRASRGSP